MFFEMQQSVLHHLQIHTQIICTVEVVSSSTAKSNKSVSCSEKKKYTLFYLKYIPFFNSTLQI